MKIQIKAVCDNRVEYRLAIRPQQYVIPICMSNKRKLHKSRSTVHQP